MAANKILVVDDDTAMRELMALALSKEGYEVETAATSTAALELITPDAFDLMVTDIYLGDGTGLDLLERCHSICPAARVILVTAHGTVETAASARRLGVFDYLAKPFEINALVERVRAALRSPAPGLKRVGRSVDDSIASLWRALETDHDALVVVSDHGMIPIHEIVRPNVVLDGAGLLKTVDDDGRLRIAPDTPMVAVASAAVINLYLNLAGREPGGVVSTSEAPELLRRAARAFADLEVEGRPVTEKIFTCEEAAAVGLDNPNSGDLVVFLAPGFTAAGGLAGPNHEPSRYYGQHGYLASHDEMCGMLFARGAGIKKNRGPEVPAIDVAPMVARWLGFNLGGSGAGAE